jgi:tight adherence protein C
MRPDGTSSATAAKSLVATILLGGGEARAEIERYLAAAGFLTRDGALIFGVLRLVFTAGTFLGLYAALTLRHASVAVSWAVPIGAAALVFLAAKFIVKLSSARRSRKIGGELPFTLDIFVMMVESGASLDQCFRAFASAEGRAAPLVRVSVVQLVDDIQRGMPYDQALARWADRLGVPGARELASVLRQSLNQGTELAATLREFAREFAERRIFAARESIGRKTTQMTIAMLVLLMPALMIVLAGPAVSTLGTTINQISSK